VPSTTIRKVCEDGLSVALLSERTDVDNFDDLRTSQHKTAPVRSFPGVVSKIFPLTEFVGMAGEVVDPIAGGLTAYLRFADQLEALIGRLVVRLNDATAAEGHRPGSALGPHSTM